MTGCSRYTRRTPPASREAGFTLLEMLASLILLAAAAALLPGALQLGRRALTAGEPAAHGAASLPLRDFLAARLSQARPHAKPAVTRETGLDFSGEPHALMFVAPAAQADRRHGLVRYRIATGGEDGKLRAVMWDVEQAAVALPAAQAVLSETPAAVSFRYFGRKAQDDKASWHGTWMGERVLPRLVEITIDPQHGGASPPAVVALRLAPAD